MDEMAEPDRQRPYCVVWGTGRGCWASEVSFGRPLYDLPSDIALLGILTCESDFRWCWCPPFGTDRPRSPYSDRSHTGLYRRQRMLLRAEIRSSISSTALKASSDGLKFIPKCRRRTR